MLKVVLYGGECDGLVHELEAEDKPEVYFAVPLLVREKIQQTVRSPIARGVAYSKSKTLAYVFDKARYIDDELIYCYLRSPDRDKTNTSL